MAKGQSSLRGRSAGSGRFMSVEAARSRPNTATVERVPKPGLGAESSTPRGRDARTGHFIPVSEAERRPATTIVERVQNPRK
jgi:hypothetical protein